MDNDPNIYQEYGEERARGDQLHSINADLLKALERIAAGNPAAPGQWLTDIEMANIARAAIAKAKADAAGGG